MMQLCIFRQLLALVLAMGCIVNFANAQDPKIPKVIEYSDAELASLLRCRSTISDRLVWCRFSSNVEIYDSSEPDFIFQSPSRRLKLTQKSLRIIYKDEYLEEFCGWLPCLSDVTELVIDVPFREVGIGKFRSETLDFFTKIAALPNLTALYFKSSGAELHDRYIEALSQCDRLVRLRIGSVANSDIAPLKSLANLEALSVSNCRENIFEVLASLPKIRSVNLNSTHLDDQISPQTSELISQLDGRLKSFGIETGNQVHVSIARALSEVKSLEFLILEDIRPPPTLPEMEALTSLPNLQVLRLQFPSSSQVSEEVRADISKTYHAAGERIFESSQARYKAAKEKQALAP